MVEQHLLESKFSFSWQRLGGWDRDILSCFHWQDAESEKRKQSPPAARRGPGSQRRFFKRAPLSNTFSAGCHPLEHLLISDSDLNDLNMSHRISHNAPSKTNSCVKVLRVKAMLTDRSRLSHAGSFLGFPPLWSSAPPPVQAHTSSPAVGGVLEHALTCCTAWLNRQRERERERQPQEERQEAGGQQFSSVKWPTHRESPWTDSCWCQHVECTRWRSRWMVDLGCCPANWWVSKLCVNRCLWHTQQCYSWTLLRTCALLLKLSEIFRNTN